MSAKLSGVEINIERMPSAQELADAGILSDRQAEIWLLREIEGCSTEETADLIGIAPSTVSTQLSRARDRVESIQETAELIERAERSRDQLAEMREGSR